MNYFSVRIDDSQDPSLIEKLNDFASHEKFMSVIFCRETYSPKLKSITKPHYHIGIGTLLQKSSLSTRLLKIAPELKSKRNEACLYNIKVYDTSEKDIKNWRQYHCKGKGIGDYHIVRSTFEKEVLDNSNRGYWEDNQAFIETVKEQRKKRSIEALMEFMHLREEFFILKKSHFERASFCNRVEKHYRQLDCEKMFEQIIHFYSGSVQYNILELRYNQVLYHYDKGSLIYDMKVRFQQNRSLGKIDLLDVPDVPDVSCTGISYTRISDGLSYTDILDDIE